MNWDDLRIIAAVRDDGTYAGASARLRIDETTVGRRLARIERALGCSCSRPSTACAGRPAMRDGAGACSGDGGPCRRDRQDRREPAGHRRPLSHRLHQRGGGGIAGAARRRLAGAQSGPHTAIPHLQREREILALGRPISPSACASRTRATLPFRSSRSSASISSSRPSRSGAEPVICAYPDDLGSIPESQFLKARGLQQRARCVTDNVRVIRGLIAVASGRGHPARIFLRRICSPTAVCAPRCCRGAATSGSGAEPSQARSRGAGRDRLAARLLS